VKMEGGWVCHGGSIRLRWGGTSIRVFRQGRTDPLLVGSVGNSRVKELPLPAIEQRLLKVRIRHSPPPWGGPDLLGLVLLLVGDQRGEEHHPGPVRVPGGPRLRGGGGSVLQGTDERRGSHQPGSQIVSGGGGGPGGAGVLGALLLLLKVRWDRHRPLRPHREAGRRGGPPPPGGGDPLNQRPHPPVFVTRKINHTPHQSGFVSDSRLGFHNVYLRFCDDHSGDAHSQKIISCRSISTRPLNINNERRESSIVTYLFGSPLLWLKSQIKS